MFHFLTRGLAILAAVCLLAPGAQAAVLAPSTTAAMALVKQAAQQIDAGAPQAALATLGSIPAAGIPRDSVREIAFIGELLNAGQVVDARQAVAGLAADLAANDATLNDHEREEFERGKREGYRRGRRDHEEHRPYDPWTHEGNEHFRRGYHEGYEEGWRSVRGLTANDSKSVTPAAGEATGETTAVASLNGHEQEEYEQGKREGYRRGRRDHEEHRPYDPWTHEGGEHYRRGYHDGYEEGWRSAH